MKKARDGFLDYVEKMPPTGRPEPYLLDIDGMEYRSGAKDPGTQSLVLEVDDNTGAAREGHPDTRYQVFNYDLGKHAVITIDTLFAPGADPLPVLSAAAQPLLEKRFGDEVVPALHDAGLKAYENFAITDDSVLFFKGGFSDLRASAMSYFRVFDEGAYRQLCAEKVLREVDETGKEFATALKSPQDRLFWKVELLRRCSAPDGCSSCPTPRRGRRCGRPALSRRGRNSAAPSGRTARATSEQHTCVTRGPRSATRNAIASVPRRSRT